MKMSELILAIGDDNVEFQNLDECSLRLSYSHTEGGKITFGTQVAILPTGTKKLGLVLWLDRDAVKRALVDRGPPA